MPKPAQSPRGEAACEVQRSAANREIVQAHTDIPWDVDHGQSQAKAKHSAKHVCVGKQLALGCCERGNGRHREGARGEMPSHF